MDFLLAEVERKRKQIDSNEVTANKKYFKRGELAAKQAADYHKQQEEKLKSKGDVAKAKIGPNENLNTGSNKTVGNKSKKNNDPDKKDKKLPLEEIFKRLRERGEPVMLFGETEEQISQRLRYVEMMKKDDDKGLRNDFKAAMDKIDQDSLDDLINNQGESSGSKGTSDIKVKGEMVSLDKIKEMALELRKGDAEHAADVILVFLKHLQFGWAERLNARDQNLKASLQGKLESGRFQQTSSYLQPLYRKLRTRSIDEEILEFLRRIVASMLDKDYVKASDWYLQMAIGNAPWPIGVTMVGIHARTGREKIFSQHVAHVLNDETQRKYIQGLKRLMTCAQKLYPAAPSKSVEYNGVNL